MSTGTADPTARATGDRAAVDGPGGDRGGGGARRVGRADRADPAGRRPARDGRGLVGGFWFIAKRGVLRWVGLALAVALVVVIFFGAGVVAVALVSLVLGGAAARHALRHTAKPWLPTSAPVPAAHPFIVMTPRSGGGKVVRFDPAPRRGRWAPKVVLLRAPVEICCPGPTWLFGCALRGRVQLNWSSQWW